MKKIALIFLLSPLLIFAQKLGDVAPPEPPKEFPPNTLGLDLMIGEGGFGLGGFYRKDLSDNLTWFTDLSFSEVKDDREFEYIDYWGRVIVVGKKNRVFQLPVYTGFQYRLFKESLTENLRPYITIGAGPNFVITTPFDNEFFGAFGSAQAKIGIGGYAGIGANFGINPRNLLGLNVRYYYSHLFDGGVEGMQGVFRENLTGIYLTITLGTMF